MKGAVYHRGHESRALDSSQLDRYYVQELGKGRFDEPELLLRHLFIGVLRIHEHRSRLNGLCRRECHTAHHGTISNSANALTDALDTNMSNNYMPAMTTVVNSLNCPPGSRPNVDVNVSPFASQTLRIIVTAGTTSQPTNRLEWIQLGATVNALIDVTGGPSNQSGPFTRFYVDRATSHDFFLRRLVGGGNPATVGLIVRDNCGAWNTFVGGGSRAFP